MHAEPAPHLRFETAVGEHLFVTRYSRLFDLDPSDARQFDSGDGAMALIDNLGRETAGDEALGVPTPPDPQSISLNVSSRCNLSCSYCYAGGGAFAGRQSSEMEWDVARASVDRLIELADPLRPITVGFMGGEPLVARRLIEQVVDYASALATRRALDIRYSLTTNGTLLQASDIALFRDHAFAVTVSLDGTHEDQDRQRPQAGGRGSWARVAERVAPLLADPGRAKLAARATVTAQSASPTAIFDAIIGLGFPEAGLSPLRSAADTLSAISGVGWEAYGDGLIALAEREAGALRRGEPLRLTNLAVALKQIHRGACSPYPCGAGGGYFSVGSTGDWYACHRAIGDERFLMGSSAGLDAVRRAAFLEERHVDGQTDCATCWARYLCSGGCHHEASARSPESCDFVRRWLKFCLTTYCELGELHRHLIQREEPIHG